MDVEGVSNFMIRQTLKKHEYRWGYEAKVPLNETNIVFRALRKQRKRKQSEEKF